VRGEMAGVAAAAATIVEATAAAAALGVPGDEVEGEDRGGVKDVDEATNSEEGEEEEEEEDDKVEEGSSEKEVEGVEVERDCEPGEGARGIGPSCGG